MDDLLKAMDELHTAQLMLLKRWHRTYNELTEQNDLLTQQVDYLQERIAELENMLMQERTMKLVKTG